MCRMVVRSIDSKLPLGMVFISVILFLVSAGGVGAVPVTGCGTLNTTGETYVLSNDIISASGGTCFTIGANNIILDGAGYSITGSGGGYGVYLYSRSGVTVKNLNVSGFSTGIYLSGSSRNSLTNNTALNNDYGINLLYSHNNTITDNTASDNQRGIFLTYSSNYNTLINNTANLNSGDGIYLGSSSNNILTNNTVSNNDNGIYLAYSSNYNTLINNNANSNNNYGIYLLSSTNNTITNNNANSNNRNGIGLYRSSNYNTLINNNANSNNNYGIWLYSSTNNTITNNTASDNTQYGIYLRYSSYNIIYLNNFINNTDNSYSLNTFNIWDSQEPITYTYNSNTYTNYLGNYWSDYSGSDLNGDGIGDSSYGIDGDSDGYPLMEPWENYEILGIKELEGKIVFSSSRDGNYEIYVMNADGSNQMKLTYSVEKDTEPSWSPDGNRIAFRSGESDGGNLEIYVMNADGSNQINIANNIAVDAMPSWSPMGDKIAFLSTRNIYYDVYVMDADGSNTIRLTYNNDGSTWSGPSWSPDGKKIAFESKKAGNWNIYVVNADGTTVVRLTNNTATDGNPSWSPDGNKIVFSSSRDGNYEIYVMNADGSNPIRITYNTASDLYPVWSPDSNHIAFTSDRDGNHEIYVMNADGSNQQRLTTNTGQDFRPDWAIGTALPADTTPPAATTDLTITETTANSITLTWTAPGDDGNTGTASQYDIRYSTSPIEDNWGSAAQAAGEPAPKPAGSSESFMVTGLTSGTTYYFALKTGDEVPNWSGLSNVVSGTTETPTPSVSEWIEVQEDGGCIYNDENGEPDETTPLKCLPNGWILKRITENENPVEKEIDGKSWWKVIDVTDEVLGWMKESYLNDDQNKQMEWKEKTEKIDPREGGTVPVILEAVDHYYNNKEGIPRSFTSFDEAFNNGDLEYGKTNDNIKYLQIILKSEVGEPTYPEHIGTTGYFGDITRDSLKKFQEDNDLDNKDGIIGESTASKLNSLLEEYRIKDSALYSSNDEGNHLSLFKEKGFPGELILAIATQESGLVDFNNEIITFDYGHGIMQITFRPVSSDIKYLQIVLNSDPDTRVAETGDGSPGQETNYFGQKTNESVIEFQEKYTSEILTPVGLSSGNGRVGPYTRAKLSELLESNRESFQQKGIPSNFKFEDYLFKGRKDVTDEGETFDNRGKGSRLKVPPCDNIRNSEDKNHYKNCYKYDEKSGGFEYKEYEPHKEYNNQIFKYYSNFNQSIHANIKDGLRVLKDKYRKKCPKESINIVYKDEKYTLTCSDMEKILATWGYNGYGEMYLSEVGIKLDNLKDYFPGVTYANTDNLIEKLKAANTNQQTIRSYSPIELQVIDSQGRIAGLVNGVLKEDIPISGYDKDYKTVGILFSNDSYLYNVVGTDNGTYGLLITSVEEGNATTFTATDIPTLPNATHQYSVNWTALSQGEEGVTLHIDSDGDGTFEQTITSDGELSQDEFILQTETTIDIKPDTLNLKSNKMMRHGRWVTSYIELPEGYDVADINVSMVLLNDTISAKLHPSDIGDYDNDGIPDLMVKFDRADVIDMVKVLNPDLPAGVELAVTGTLTDGTQFEGSDTIRVIEKGRHMMQKRGR